MLSKIPKILIIAGSDSCGGAGIQADIKTAAAHQVHSSSAITCLTAQNTCGVFAIHHTPIDFLRKQIEVVLNDISFDAIKIGMLGNTAIIDVVADVLANVKDIPVILDSVMVATSGDVLLEKEAVSSLKSKLINGCKIVTPNIDEAEILAQTSIKTVADMKKAAMRIKSFGAQNVLIKGGHLDSQDSKIKNILLDEAGKFYLITNKKVKGSQFHGTGCTLSTSIACNIAKGFEIDKAIRKSNAFVYRSILANMKIGKGSSILKNF